MNEVPQLVHRPLPPEGGTRRGDIGWCLALALAALTLFFFAKTRVLPGLEGPLTFDGQYYMSIFEQGYRFDGDIEHKQNSAFMPLTAAAIGGVTRLIPGAHDLAEVAVFGAAVLFGTLLGLHALAAPIGGRAAARLATLLWAASPMALYNFVGYSEPLFALLAAWAFVAIARRRLWVAAMLAGIALLGRPQAIVLAAFVGIAVLQQARWRPRELLAGPGALQLCAIVVPLLAFATWEALRFHDAAAYINSLEAWRRGSFMDGNLAAGPAFLHLFRAVSDEARTLSHWTTLLATLSVATIATTCMFIGAAGARIAMFYAALLAFLFASASFDATNIARHTFFMFPWALILGAALARMPGGLRPKLLGLAPMVVVWAMLNAHAVMRYYRGEWVS